MNEGNFFNILRHILPISREKINIFRYAYHATTYDIFLAKRTYYPMRSEDIRDRYELSRYNLDIYVKMNHNGCAPK
jgi:hypothetical protein